MKLRAWRKSKGLTQHQLAEASGLSHARISMIERGDGLPSPEAAKRLELVTNGVVTAAELLGLESASSMQSGMSEGTKAFEHSSLGLPPLLLEEAASYGLDPGEIARAAVERAVKTERMKRFSNENREAIESWNELVKREGLWSDGLRVF